MTKNSSTIWYMTKRRENVAFRITIFTLIFPLEIDQFKYFMMLRYLQANKIQDLMYSKQKLTAALFISTGFKLEKKCVSPPA